MNTRRQVEILLFIFALVVVEWLLFVVLRTAPQAGRKVGLIVVMVAIALVWGGSLIWLFVHTRFTLWAYFVFLTLASCLIAGISYMASMIM